jgi:PPOX class probable F420-dependent enzyme
MSDEQVWDLLRRPLTASLGTHGPDGYPHVAAIWYVPVDGEVRIATYAASQKAVNLRRNPACAFHVEAGETYDELRGVLVRSPARLVDDADLVLEVMCGVYERYRRAHQGPMSPEVREQYRQQARKRVAVCLPVENVASWDHRLLAG